MKFHYSIKQQLVGLIILLVVPLSSLFIFATYQHISEDLSSASDSSVVLANIIASDVSDYIASREDILIRIAERERIKQFDPTNCDPILLDFRNFDANFSNVIVINGQGTVVCSAIPLQKNISYARSRNFNAVLEENRLIIGSPSFGKISKKWIIALNYPIRDETENVIGSIGAPIDLYEYTPVNRETKLPFDALVLITDRNGTILSANQAPKTWVGSNLEETFPELKSARFDIEGASVTANKDRENFLLAASPVAETNWYALVLMPRQQVLSSAISRAEQQGAAGILIIGLIVFAGLVIARKIEKPIQNVTRAAQLVSQGDVEQRLKPSGAVELQSLAKQFNKMLEIRLQAEQTAREYAKNLELAMDSARIGTWSLSLHEGNIVFSDNIHSLLDSHGLLNIRSLSDFVSRVYIEDQQDFNEALNKTINQGCSLDLMEFRVLSSENILHWFLMKGRLLNSAENLPELITGIIMDITERVLADEQIRYMATHDSMTKLVNRHEFEKRLSAVLKKARFKNSQHVFLYLDLDQFKIVNDTCGHHAGDELLSQLTSLLKEQVRETDTIGRLGGDEFGILLENCPLGESLNTAEQIRSCVNEFRFVWEDRTFKIGVSIGLVPIKDNRSTCQQVMSAADAACFIAKDKGRNRIHVHKPDDSIDALHMGEMEWVSKINKAFEENRFTLFYQTIKPLQKAPEGLFCELLVRMVGTNNEVIPPMAFIPAAERYGLMSRIDRWVIEYAFKFLGSKKEGSAKSQVEKFSINISAISLNESDFQEFIREQFIKNEIPAGVICFEITETAAIANLQQARKFIMDLRQLGISFALDDFGSGMSSFAYLKTLDVDYLKIDGSFVTDILHDPIDLAMLESINNIGHVMEIKTIAEYAETPEIIQKLKNIKLDFAQGYGISQPKPLTELMLDTNNVTSIFDGKKSGPR